MAPWLAGLALARGMASRSPTPALLFAHFLHTLSENILFERSMYIFSAQKTRKLSNSSLYVFFLYKCFYITFL